MFGINGFLLAMWVVHIPAIEDRTNIAHSTLGSLLLLLALGAIAGMQLAGPLADRYGSRLLVALSGILLSIAVIGPGLASTAWQLGLALLVFGFANGALDVSMNSQAVLTEREYGRPIMSAFHGMFSIGGVVGSLIGAVTIGAAGHRPSRWPRRRRWASPLWRCAPPGCFRRRRIRSPNLTGNAGAGGTRHGCSRWARWRSR
ncbi:MFS transporter [Rhodococcus hoagii]|nr:MFS transporter [Prescottella equi]